MDDQDTLDILDDDEKATQDLVCECGREGTLMFDPHQEDAWVCLCKQCAA